MRAIGFLVSAAGFLSGCAAHSTSVAPEVSLYDVELAPWHTAQSIESVTFKRAGSLGSLPQCIAATVSNDGETLSDSSGSFFGPATGNYYSVTRATQVAGGNVIECASPDGASVVASGTTRYSAGPFVSRSVRFKLDVRQNESGRVYRYSSLAQAQADTGAVANAGYNPIGAWSASQPGLALGTLDELTDKIESCLAR